jgi:hypothetical protein
MPKARRLSADVRLGCQFSSKGRECLQAGRKSAELSIHSGAYGRKSCFRSPAPPPSPDHKMESSFRPLTTGLVKVLTRPRRGALLTDERVESMTALI